MISTRYQDGMFHQADLFRALLDQSTDAIEIVDPETLRLLDVNQTACVQLGYSREELLSMSISDIHPNLSEDSRARVEQQLRESGVAMFETEHRRKDGSTFAVEVNYRRVHREKMYGVALARDITARKRSEEALRLAQTELAHVTRVLAIGELVTSIAHEVNQPLTAILTTSNVVRREMQGRLPNLEEVREAVTEIAEDALRIKDIISRIRALVKKDFSDRVELNLNYVIREAALVVSHEATRHDVHVRLDLGINLPSVVGDRVQLQQVIINLAMNGIDAMHADMGRARELVIKSEHYGDGVLIQVQDNGIGLNADQVDRIFESFFTTKAQGIGMGLSISRSIIESHGGRLWAEPVSQGAVFQITLPASLSGQRYSSTPYIELDRVRGSSLP
jgi:PAS domain S-box-containing protein